MPLMPSLLILWSMCTAKGMTEKIVVLKDLTAGETHKQFWCETSVAILDVWRGGLGKQEWGWPFRLLAGPQGWMPREEMLEVSHERWVGTCQMDAMEEDVLECHSASVQRHKGTWKVRVQSVPTSKICAGDGCIVMKLEGQAAEKAYTF